MNMTEANLKLVLKVLTLMRQYLEHPIGVQMTKQQIVVGIDKVSAVVEVALADTQYWGEEHRLLIQKELAADPPQRTWVGLTDEEVNDLYMEGMGIHATIEATEAKLKEKNNAALPEQGDKNDA